MFSEPRHVRQLPEITSYPAAEEDAAGMAVLDSTCLLSGKHEIFIRHGDQYYRLRHTRNDKLILTK